MDIILRASSYDVVSNQFLLGTQGQCSSKIVSVTFKVVVCNSAQVEADESTQKGKPNSERTAEEA